MSRNISEICLEIGKTVKRSGASAEASIKVDELLVEIVEATAMAQPEDQEFWETDSVKEVIRLWNPRV